MKLDIEKFKPCSGSLKWYSLQKSSVQAWNDCPRGDWMLWIAERLGVDRKKLILIGAKCANTVRYLMNDERSRNAVDIFIAYGEGRATKEEFEKAIAEAAEAYYDASDACAEAYSAYSAYSATRSSDAAVTAAYASNAAYYAAGESQEAKKANELETATICREILTEDILLIIKNKKHYGK